MPTRKSGSRVARNTDDESIFKFWANDIQTNSTRLEPMNKSLCSEGCEDGERQRFASHTRCRDPGEVMSKRSSNELFWMAV